MGQPVLLSVQTLFSPSPRKKSWFCWLARKFFTVPNLNKTRPQRSNLAAQTSAKYVSPDNIRYKL